MTDSTKGNERKRERETAENENWYSLEPRKLIPFSKNCHRRFFKFPPLPDAVPTNTSSADACSSNASMILSEPIKVPRTAMSNSESKTLSNDILKSHEATKDYESLPTVLGNLSLDPNSSSTPTPTADDASHTVYP